MQLRFPHSSWPCGTSKQGRQHVANLPCTNKPSVGVRLLVQLKDQELTRNWNIYWMHHLRWLRRYSHIHILNWGSVVHLKQKVPTTWRTCTQLLPIQSPTQNILLQWCFQWKKAVKVTSVILFKWPESFIFKTCFLRGPSFATEICKQCPATVQVQKGESPIFFSHLYSFRFHANFVMKTFPTSLRGLNCKRDSSKLP